MKSIFCIGLGKLGLIFSQILAEHGYFVYGNDKNPKVQRNITSNLKDPEPLLNDLIKKNRKKFIHTKNYKEAISNSFCTFLVLPTPSKKNKEFDNSYIIQSLMEIGPHLKNKKKYLINITSTVNPGSCNLFIKLLEEKFNLVHGKEFILTYNPHLIALGSIYNDVMNSDLVIIGSDLKDGSSILKNIYKKLYKKKISKLQYLNLKEAEISKISINTYITMKISYTNTISQIADVEMGVNTSKILNTIGFDKRIGHNYLKLGAMYSGPCFPRDNLNFSKYLSNLNLKSKLPLTIDEINNIQIKRYIKIFKRNLKHLKVKPVIGICGLSYKDKTSLTVHSPGEQLIKYFKHKNKVVYYDNYAKFNWKDKNCVRIKNLKNFFKLSDVIFVCYKDSNFKTIEKCKTRDPKIIIDLWNFINTCDKKVKLIKLGISQI